MFQDTLATKHVLLGSQPFAMISMWYIVLHMIDVVAEDHSVDHSCMCAAGCTIYTYGSICAHNAGITLASIGVADALSRGMTFKFAEVCMCLKEIGVPTQLSCSGVDKFLHLIIKKSVSR